MKVNTGGPAFPASIEQMERGVEGMSLRDWFAGMALTSIATHDWAGKDWWEVAQDAYCAADAMMAEKEKVCQQTTTP